MPQHLWHDFSRTRFCEVCFASQRQAEGDWSPPVSPICPGDDEDGGRRARRKPLTPAGGTPLRVRDLESA
jgi:hypothetical protein